MFEIFNKFKQLIFKDLNIQTPGLKALVVYFGHVGVQLQKVTWKNRRSVLNALWNLTIDLILLYGLLTLDPFQLETIKQTCATSKPMFNQLVAIIDRYVYPSIFVINVVYAYFFGVQILHLLDSDCIYQFYRQGCKWNVIYIAFIGSHFLFFFLFFSDKINVHGFSQWPTGEEMLRYCCMYACLYQYWVCGILHYSQFATFKLLMKIESKMHLHMTVLEQCTVLEEIRTLAVINDELSKYTSLPMIVFIILNTFNIIMFLCITFVCKPIIGLLLHALVSVLYFAFLISLNDQVLRTLRRIFAIYRKMSLKSNEQTGVTGSGPLFQMYRIKPGFVKPWNNPIKWYLHESSESRKIRCNQLDLYCKYFNIKLFHLGKLDLPFLLQVSMFVLSYVVLISQTN